LILFFCSTTQQSRATKVWVTNKTKQPIEFKWKSWLAGIPGAGGQVPGKIKPENTNWGDDLGGVYIRLFKK